MGTSISQLTDDIRPNSDEYKVPVAYNGNNYRVDLRYLFNFDDSTIGTLYMRNSIFRFGAGVNSVTAESTALGDGAPILYVDEGKNLNFRKINDDGYARIYLQNSHTNARGASIGIAANRSPLNGYIGFRYSNRTTSPVDGRLSCEILNTNVESSQVTMQWQCSENRFVMSALYYPEDPNSSAGSNGVQVSTSNGQEFGGLVGINLHPKITSSTNSASVVQERGLIPEWTNNTGITMDIGDATNKWKNIYATNGTIQTSDKNLKQDISSLEDAERKVAFKLKDMVKKFRWIESVEKKGEDARIHIGFIAQEVEKAFSDEGLDARRYSLFCVDKIYEVFRDGVSLNRTQGQNEWFVRNDESETDEGITYIEKEKYSLRLDQVLAFVISAL